MEKIKKYKLEFVSEEFENYVYDMFYKLDGKPYILNKNIKTFSPIEKFIHDSCRVHCSNNNMLFADDNYVCEFWPKTTDYNTYNLHIDRDDGVYRTTGKTFRPEFTIITYLSTSGVPTIITNTENDNIVSQPAINFSLPEKNTQIIFAGGNFMHGSIPFMKEHMFHERNALVINIWKDHIPYEQIYYPEPLYNNIYDVTTPPVRFQQKILNNLRFDSLDRESYDNLITHYTKAERYLNIEDDIKLIEPFYKVIQNFITRSCDIYTVYYPIYKNNLCVNKFLVISVATDKTHPGYKNYINMLHTHGIHYRILGLNTSWKGGNMEIGMGGGHKINLLKEELSTWDENTTRDTIILFTDSYDVLINSTENKILNCYYDAITKYNKHNCVLFSAEKSCWPDISLASKYPDNNSPYAYLNSGGFIGSARNIYSLIRDATVSNTDDDQLFFTNIYLNDKFKERITLDYNCYLFQTLNDSISDVAFNGQHLLHNILLNTYPLVIHGNGPEQYKQFVYNLFYIIKHNLYKVKYAGNDLFTPETLSNTLYKYGIENPMVLYN